MENPPPKWPYKSYKVQVPTKLLVTRLRHSIKPASISWVALETPRVCRTRGHYRFLQVSHEKNTRILSMKSWLVCRDPYNQWFMEAIPYITG